MVFKSDNYSQSDIELIVKNVHVVDDYKLCFDNASSISILTEWDEFKEFNWKELIKMMEKQYIIMDGRNLLDKNSMNKITNKYFSIGIKTIKLE